MVDSTTDHSDNENSQPGEPGNRMIKNIIILVIAQVAAMALWFITAAILVDMTRDVTLSSGASAALSSAVQGGFVLGALFSAFTGIADRFQPRLVFAISVWLGALATALLLVVPVGSVQAILLRAFTGFCLAGVYPVGMKIAIGWSAKHRGFLVGLLVGGLTLGSAAPHLLTWLGGADWRSTIAIACLLAACAGVLILFTENGPLHATSAKFDVKTVGYAWTNRNVRRAYGGYLGHMWELYVMWAWVGLALTISFSQQLEADTAQELAKLVTFFVIAAGAFSCAIAGRIADVIGKAELTIIAMAISGISALLFAFFFGGPVWLMIAISLLWGMSIIPDSAQFSALVADYTPAEKAGSLMTFQTALGFALTTVTVQLAPWVASVIGWPLLMALLALGPMFGIYSMWGLKGKR
jgi:MFS family permease